MRDDDIDGPWQYSELICPQCFMLLAEERIGHHMHWRLYAEKVGVPLKTVTPSGRTWNPDTWLWDDPVLIDGPGGGE
jgi:hypothetical protein